MCAILSVKLGEELGQNRHCPGVNGCIAALRWPAELIKELGNIELVSGLDDKLIGLFDVSAVVVVVVDVVVTIIEISWN